LEEEDEDEEDSRFSMRATAKCLQQTRIDEGRRKMIERPLMDKILR
jgi:hypothetical protein